MNTQITNDLLSFINEARTQFHAVTALSKLLEKNGFSYLDENKEWKIEKNASYYTTRNASSLIAFKVGNTLENYSFNMVASHLDSPTFKIKPNSIIKKDKYITINTEGYGGMILSTWLDRPLSIAGRVLLSEGNTVKSKLLTIERDLLLIPNLAIHLNRTINDGFKYNKQIDMLPLFSMNLENEDPFLDMIAKELHVSKQDVLTYDLYLYNRQAGSIWGYDSEFVSSGRLDDLQCAYPSICSLIDSFTTNSVNVCCCFDNEEVGSGTMQGAASNFLLTTLERINQGLHKSSNDFNRALAASLMVSADNAHAAHPNHLELSDSHNRVYMNQGVVIKFNAAQRYTSDGVTASLFMRYCKQAGVPYQFYTNRSDQLGGSTLGSISTSQVSVASVDVGLAQLSMHSSYETAGVKDTYYFYQVLLEYYNSHLSKNQFGDYVITK